MFCSYIRPIKLSNYYFLESSRLDERGVIYNCQFDILRNIFRHYCCYHFSQLDVQLYSDLFQVHR